MHRSIIDQGDKFLRNAFQKIFDLSMQYDKCSKIIINKLESTPIDTISSEVYILNINFFFINYKKFLFKGVELSLLDRYSDSTIEDKMQKDGVNVAAVEIEAPYEVNKKMMYTLFIYLLYFIYLFLFLSEPMNELIKSEKDYIEHLHICIEVYLQAYRMSGSLCPISLRNKETEIFGNIDKLYSFHSEYFIFNYF